MGDESALSVLDPCEPERRGFWKFWSLSKILLATLTLVPIRFTLLVALFLLMCLVSLVAMLLGCFTCRAGGGTLSVKVRYTLCQ